MNKDIYSRIVVKIGSNVLTRPDGTLDITRMSAIVDQIAELHHKGTEVIMITSGAVASGRNELKHLIDKKIDEVSARQLFSAVGQAKLINRYYELFRDHGIVCGQILTTKENFATRRLYLNQKHCTEVMLKNGVIPIVNENDTVSITELMFTDNDELSGLIASMVGAEALIILSNIDGVFDGDPASPESHVILDIYQDAMPDADSFIQTKKSSLGRGGMGSKFRIAHKVAEEGINVIIVNGKRENILLETLSGKRQVPYTIFHANTEPVPGVKKWIAHSEGFAKGKIKVNKGAYEVLNSSHAASILPVGVTEIEGDFEKDDIVQVISPEDDEFAVGRIGVDSEKARSMIGKKGERPLIHYDFLYIFKGQ